MEEYNYPTECLLFALNAGLSFTKHKELYFADTETSHQLQPVFISIDPERDSVPQVKEYVKEFHPRMIGLTGPIEKVSGKA